jgi:broad specificity phosphatase PhoE
MPGGESFRHFYERVSGGLEDLLTGSHGMQIHQNTGFRIWQIPPRDQRILIVSHQGTSGVILSHLLGIEPVPWAWVRFAAAWAAISAIRTEAAASGHIWVLDHFNRSGHLAGLPEPDRS